MTTFEIVDDDFVLDDRPHQVLSGAIHYFRVHPDLWADRIRKARSMGLNTIETYVPWNQHEPARGRWVDTGQLDLARFLDIIAAEGMHAIVRPGPYICAEWTGGGLPSWLFALPGVRLRSNEQQYMSAVGDYLQQVLAIVEPRQIDAGGPVILVQIENEYGAYGDDADYLRQLVRITREAGIRVPLTTVDQPTAEMLRNGSLPELLKTGSFGSRSAERLATLREHQATGPLMCSEFWDGWFDSWGEHHHTTDVEQSARDLDALLAAGASVNIYMFHGGTNFGFTNGANDKGVYKPIVTSYDYDAPLDEAGNPTPKFWAFREVLGRYTTLVDAGPSPALPAPGFTSRLNRAMPLRSVQESLGEWLRHEGAPTFDALGHDGPLALYATDLAIGAPGDDAPAMLEVGEVRDRAHVFLDGTKIGTLSRDHHERALSLTGARGELSMLVEELGRVDYGPRLGEPKGLMGPVSLNGRPLTDWRVLPLDLTRFEAIAAALDAAAPVGDSLPGPSFARGTFTLDDVTDLFLDTSGWGKGAAWMNGFNLGRYWSRGPQHTLYVPAPALHTGVNWVTVLELDAAASTAIRFVPGPDLGHTEE